MRIFAQWPKQSVIPLLLLGCHAQYAIHQPLATRDLPIRVRGLNSLPSRTHPSITHVGLTYPMNYPPKKYPSKLVKLRFSFCSLPIFSTFSPRFPTRSQGRMDSALHRAVVPTNGDTHHAAAGGLSYLGDLGKSISTHNRYISMYIYILFGIYLVLYICYI